MCQYKMKITSLLAGLFLMAAGALFAEDVYLNDGASYEIDYLIEGSLWIENASVGLYSPAHITGFTITGSGTILDIYGGQIDYMLLVSTNDNGLPDGIVTIYGTDFAVDGVPVAPDTAELFLSNKTLTGVYEDGTPFSMVVDCTISGNASYLHYQTLKLGWIVSEPRIEVSQADYDFGLNDIGSTGLGVITVYNAGNANLTLNSVSVIQNEPIQFGFTHLQVIPVTLEPGMSMELELYFAPSVEGLSEASLHLFSSDPTMPDLEIQLLGEGAAVEITAAEQAQAVLDFLQEGLATGTLAGEGKGQSASNKAATFCKMIAAAKQLIDAGYYDYAIEALNDIQKKCDGKKAPVDFVTGQDMPVLHGMIMELMNRL
jgi:hypothetical protein